MSASPTMRFALPDFSISEETRSAVSTARLALVAFSMDGFYTSVSSTVRLAELLTYLYAKISVMP